MTDQELAQAVSDRINAAEAQCQAIIDDPAASASARRAARARLRRLTRAHGHLDKARLILLGGGEIGPLSGGGMKP